MVSWCPSSGHAVPAVATPPGIFLYIRPVPSSSRALGRTARSLHQLQGTRQSCNESRAPWGGHGLCLQTTLVHGTAVGTSQSNPRSICCIYSREN